MTAIIVFILLLAACSQGKEESEVFSGIIGEGKAMGYEYTITKKAQSFSWKIGYKGAITTLDQDSANEVNLESFMTTVGDSRVLLSKLIIALSYFLFVIVTSLFLFKRNRKMFHNGGVNYCTRWHVCNLLCHRFVHRAKYCNKRYQTLLSKTNE